MILALDLATRTGICAGDPSEVPALSNHAFPSTGKDVGRFLDAGLKWAGDILERVGPTLVVFESPILPQTAALPTVRKLHGLAGVVEMAAFRAGIECAELQPSVVKKNLTGKGGARKHEMVAACRHYGFDPVVYMHNGEEASDEADAFGVWLTAVRLRFPKLSHHWDPIQFSRGAQ